MTKNENYIQSIKLEVYKSIRQAEIDFKSGLNIIIGDNGSGKTNFLEFLYNSLFSRIFYDNEKIVHSLNFKSLEFSLFTKYAAHKISISYDKSKITLNIDDDEIEIELGARVTENTNIFSKFQNLIWYPKSLIKYSLPSLPTYFIDKQGFIVNSGNAQRITNNSNNHWKVINDLDFSFELFLGEKYSEIEKADTFIQQMQDFFITRISKPIIKSLRKFSPIKDIRISPNINIYPKNDEIWLENIYIEFKVNDDWMPWNWLSDGTKRLFYIITEVACSKGGIVFIDEPELGVHPHQLHQLTAFFKEEAEYTQIIITTHSPQVLNILNINELDRIIIAEIASSGTILRHLTEEKILEAQQYMQDEYLFLSDYWLHADLEAHIQ